MKMTLSRVASSILLASVAAGLAGCSSDMPILSNPKQARIEGVALYNRGNYGDAAGAFKNAIRQEPRDYKGHYYLGLSYEAMGSYQQAIQAYKAGIDCMTTSLQGIEAIDFRQRIMNRLAALIAAGDPQNAEKQLLQQYATDTSLTPQKRAEAYFLLAKIQRYRGDADSALDAYAKAVDLNPKDYWLQKEAGIYMLQAGQKQQANTPLANAYKISTHDAELNAAIEQAGGLMRPKEPERINANEPINEPPIAPAADLRLGEGVKAPVPQIEEPAAR